MNLSNFISFLFPMNSSKSSGGTYAPKFLNIKIYLFEGILPLLFISFNLKIFLHCSNFSFGSLLTAESSIFNLNS